MGSNRYNKGAASRLRWVLVGLLACAGAAQAQAGAAEHDYEVPAGDLAQAVNKLSQQSKIQVIYDLSLLKGKTASSLKGHMSLHRALDQLLAGSGLKWAQTDENTIVLQQAATAAEPASRAPAGEVKEPKDKTTVVMESVGVTASRIDRPDLVAPTPSIPITAEELQLDSRTNIGAALNDLPYFRATSSPQTTGSNTGAGNAPVDLRGLGISRTLVLVDSRRISSDNDLNTVPSILVKTVDVVTGGASAAWGSGAVGGVVNITLNHDLQGGKVGIQGGRSTFDDADERRVEAAWGTAFADGRGHFVIGGEYLDNDGIVPRSARPRAGRWAVMKNANGQLALTPDVGFSDAGYGGLILSGVLKGKAFNPDGSLRNFDYGRVVGAVMQGGEGPSNDDYSPLSAPLKRYAALASVRYDLTDTVRATADLRHSRMFNNYIWFGDHNRGNLTVQADNAFLPQAVKDAMAAAGESQLRIGRFNDDINYPHINYNRETTQATFALDGYFGESWRWTGYYSHGDYQMNIDTPGFILSKEWNYAVDSVIDPSSGKPVCRVTLSNPSVHCVPINLFGRGAPSKEAVAYVTGTPQQRSTTTLDTYGASVRGEPFSLPAGEVSVAYGLEGRREAIDQRVGAQDAAKAFRSFSFNPMKGSFTVKEAFGEVLVPVLKEVPGFQNLAFNAAARVSDYSTTGSIWSWKVGATDEVFDGFRLRAARSRDIRSANLSELFTTLTTGWNNVVDPTNNQTVYALTNGGGNRNLRPETADTTTLGVSWSPKSVEGLDFSLDYFNIDIKDVIIAINPQDILNRCQAGNQELCARVERDSSGNIVRIVNSFTNLAQYKTDGADIEASYKWKVDWFGVEGRARFRTLATWVHSLTTDDGVNTLEYVGSQGYAFNLGVPRWRAISSFSYDSERYSFNARARYISAGKYDRNQAIVNNDIGNYVYFDVGGAYRFGKDNAFEAYANVSNLGNKKSPIGSTFSPYYDVIGRYYTAGFRYKF